MFQLIVIVMALLGVCATSTGKTDSDSVDAHTVNELPPRTREPLEDFRRVDWVNQQDPERAMLRADMHANRWTFVRARHVVQQGFTRTRMICGVRNTFVQRCRDVGIEPESVPGFCAWNLEVTRYTYFESALQQNLRLFDAKGVPLETTVFSLDPGHVIPSAATAFQEGSQFQQITSDEAKARLVHWAAFAEHRYETLVEQTAAVMAQWAVGQMRSMR